MPMLMAIAEGRWLRSGNVTYLELAKRWAKSTAILFATSQVALILAGWGLALNPYLVVNDVKITDAAAPDITLQLLLGSLGFCALVLFPSFYYLFRVFKGQRAFVLFDLRGEHHAPSADATDERSARGSPGTRP